MKYLLKVTREIYRSFVGTSGEIFERSVGNIAKRNLSKDREDFLKRYINLIINTKIVSDTTKMYIRSSLPSVASVITYYNSMVDEPQKINIKTAQSKIDYDTRKLAKYFPDDMLSQIVANRNCSLKDYDKALNLAISDYGQKNKLLDNLILKLPKVTPQDSLDEDEFTAFLDMISPYIKKNIRYLEEHIPEKSVGYLLYLMSAPNLTGDNKERYKLLKEIMEDSKTI
jgi:hypothetical protein